MKVLKPYDLQVRDESSLFYNDPDYDDEVDYWVAHRDTPIVNILVGPSRCGKSTYIEKMGLTGISFPGIPMSESNKVLNENNTIHIIEQDNFKKRKVKSYIKKKESFVFDGKNLTIESRKKIMRMFPSYYRKIAIVWELSEEELIERGATQETLEETRRIYERPNDSEGIDEFIYILS